MRFELKYLFAAVILLFILTGLIFAQGNPQITNIESVNGYIKIEWKMPNNSEAGVDHYEIWRSSGSSVAINIGKADRGVFYFEDKTVSLYKTADQFFSYQIKAIGTNSTLQGKSDFVGVRFAGMNDTYKRTWGSIKAMFR